MARNVSNLLELNVDKLFEDHKIEEITEIEKILDAEIERKRVELRSMVGDRYKDVLAASDAIKNMKVISRGIVSNIENITDVCETLISNTPSNEIKCAKDNLDRSSNEMRALMVQVRLAIFLNEQIWTVLDKENVSTAAQYYLLARHIHTGTSLTEKRFLEKLPLLDGIKCNLSTLKDQILAKIKQKLEMEEITAQEASSNLVALLLLNNHTVDELFVIFINHRKNATSTVMNSPHGNVRLQISAMAKCLITTVCLIHDCFISDGNGKQGLIKQQLSNIVEKSSPPTLAKIKLPTTSLISHLPDIIKQFRPDCGNIDATLKNFSLQDWLQFTKLDVENGLARSLELITTVTGLHIIREEALKIELPLNWEKTCLECNLPDNFDVWFDFFQNLITDRARKLISKKAANIVQDMKQDVQEALSSLPQSEMNDLASYTWLEGTNDVSQTENKHTGLSMKTMGLSNNILNLCQKFDDKYLQLLKDVSQYLYGKEFEGNRLNPISVPVTRLKNKFIDQKELENHLVNEIIKNSTGTTTFLQDAIKSDTNSQLLVSKSLMCARFLRAVIKLCPNFRKCCTFNGATDNWNKICHHFTKHSVEFWENWVNRCVSGTNRAAKKQFDNINACSMISIVLRWDTVDIQERTEEKIFQSQIKVPLKPSLILNNILNKMNNDLCHVLPQTLPKNVHGQFIEKNVEIILQQYHGILAKDLGQNLALQFLFDVKFLTAFCISRENSGLVSTSQEICDQLRAKIDPFDLDVFYSYLQNNVKRAVLQNQIILGCLLPSSAQLANLGTSEKFMQQEKEPSVLATSIPSMAFPLFCTFAHQIPSQKPATASLPEMIKTLPPRPSTTPKKTLDTTIRSSAVALFGGLTTDWFS